MTLNNNISIQSLPTELLLNVCNYLDLQGMIMLQNTCMQMKSVLEVWCQKRMLKYLISHSVSVTLLSESSLSELFLFVHLVSLFDRRRPFSKINFINTFLNKGYYKVKFVQNSCNILVYGNIDIKKVENMMKQIVVDKRKISMSEHYMAPSEKEIVIVKTYYETVYDQGSINDNISFDEKRYTMVTYDIFY